MKKIILIGLLIAIFIFAAAASAQIDTSYAGRSPAIIVSMIKQVPDPVEPGNQIEISFKIDNNGTTADNVVFEIIPEYPFSLLPDEPAQKTIGTLGTSQYGKQSVIVKYKLKVAQDSSDEIHQIKIRYKTNDYDSWITIDKFSIKVQTHDVILAADKVSTLPAVTAPGGKMKLTIELKNYASSIVKDIKLSLNLDKEGDNVRPFAPIGSTNEKVIPYMEPESSLPIDFDLLVDSDATSKSYKVPLILKYSDSLNKNYSKTNVVTIVVGDSPDLGVTLERTDVYTSDSTGNVVLRLVNKGSPDIKFLNVKVLPSDNIKVVGADEVYVGKLDSDDFSTAEFKLNINGKGTVTIPVQVTYKDTNNNNYKENKEVDLKLYSSSEAKSLGLQKDGTWTWIIGVIVLAGAGYYYYRRRKRAKK